MRHAGKNFHATAITLAALIASACGTGASTPSPTTQVEPPPATPFAVDRNGDREVIRFLEQRVKQNPEDFIAYNKLNGYYLQLARESGDVKYLELAERAARASLKVVADEMNVGGLAGLAQAAHNLHDFAGARDHGERLVALDPLKSYPYQILGDALLELGDYEKAEEAFFQMQKVTGELVTFSNEVRFARLDQLHGRTGAMKTRYRNALLIASERVPPVPEEVAWCRWQLGEAAFAEGDYEKAEQSYRDALTTYPDYYRALASLGRVRAARGDLAGAIEQYEKVVKLLPDPVFVAALGDLYKLAGRAGEAARQYALVEHIARLSELNGQLYNRQLAIFYADHDLKPAEAYELAQKEYVVRHDINGADTLAWTALKAGRVPEAQAAIKEALRFNTQDAKLFYHAGLISRAAGDENAARAWLSRAMKLNPKFDPWLSANSQSRLAE
jgi:tetratricopeptide (TPR) repeat protein